MFLLFWPFAILALILSLIALVKKQPPLLVLSFFFFIPFAFYIGATPLLKGWGAVFPFFFLLAFFTLTTQHFLLTAIILLIPFFFITQVGYIIFLH